MRILLVLAIASCVLFTACEDDDHNHITIEFLEPTDGGTVADASDVHIHVRFSAEVENHEVKVMVHPESDASDLVLDYDQHAHAMVIDVEEDLDLSAYPSGTEFHVEAEACEDHDCAEVVTAELTFTLP